MTLDDILARLDALPPEKREGIAKTAAATVGKRKFIPSPGPQTEAYFCKADVLLFGGGGGGGKEQDVDSKVLTPWGWKRIGDLRVGSRICAVDGTVTEIIGVYPQGVKDIYRVRMADGGETTAGLEHRWLAWDMSKPRKVGNIPTCGQASARKYTTAQLIAAMDADCGKGNGQRKRLAIPVTGPVALNVAGGYMGPGNFVGRCVDPYFLGLLLGDGCIREKKVEVTTGDTEIVEWMRDFAGDDVRVTKRPDGNYTLSLRGETLKSVKSALASMGIDGKGSWEKSIPRQYLWGPVADRWAIFQGLMDTDGWAEPKRGIYFLSVSRDLCEGMAHLARSLGGVVSWSEKHPTYPDANGAKANGRTAWCLRIKLTEPDAAFRLSRKRQIAAGIKHQFHGRIIESIQFSHRAEAVCIEVAHPSSLYITDDFIVTHNSSLLVGLALEEHRKTLIVRRQFNELAPLVSELLKQYGSSDGFREAPTPRLRTVDGREIILGGVQGVDDWKKYQGAEKDFLGVDEAAHFLRSQVDMLMGWVRSTIPGQRTRTILATNPPLTAEGDWLIGMFRPWLDVTHPKPAKHGELRWFATTPDGKDVEVEGPDPVRFPGSDRDTLPLSRTFIPSLLKDNPFLRHDRQYQAVQDSMPEPARSAIRDGNFMLARQDDEWQVIPTQWIREAQARWTPDKPAHAPMSCLAIDIAQGGADATTLAARYDSWFAPIEEVPGVDTPTGNEIAGLAVAHRRNACTIVLDMGGGYGGAAMMRLKDNNVEGVVGHKGAAKSVRRTNDQQFGFVNKRSEAYWRFREALDPGQDGGSAVALPDDPQMVSDLTAVRFEITSGGIKITPKDKVVEMLGRSPDCFVAGTMIETPTGRKRIEEIEVGDEVVSPFGTRRIIAVHRSWADEIATLKYRGKEVLTGRPSHRVFTWDSGWKRLDAIGDTDIMEIFSIRSIFAWRIANLWNTAGRRTGFKALADIINPGGRKTRSDFFTEEYGGMLTGKSRAAFMSTTLTETGRTIGWRIWHSLRLGVTRASTCWNGLVTQSGSSAKGTISISGGTQPRNGMGPRPASSGIGKMVDGLGMVAALFARLVSPVAANTMLAWSGADFVQRRAGSAPRQTVSRHSSSLARFVGRSLRPTSISQPSAVRVNAGTPSEAQGGEWVYNLTLDEDNAYYANGILVENCGDAVVMCNMYGPKLLTHGNQWRKFSAEHGTGRAPVKVNMGRASARRKR